MFRRLIPLFMALALVAGFGVATHRTASADDWCWNDPLVKIDGQLVDISVAIAGKANVVKANVSSATYTVHVAPGTDVRTIATIGPIKENVNWVFDGSRDLKDGGQTVRVEATFQSKTSMPVALLLYRIDFGNKKVSLNGQTVMGTTDSTVTGSFTLAPAK